MISTYKEDTKYPLTRIYIYIHVDVDGNQSAQQGRLPIKAEISGCRVSEHPAKSGKLLLMLSELPKIQDTTTSRRRACEK
jgi:hypothetical protein